MTHAQLENLAKNAYTAWATGLKWVDPSTGETLPHWNDLPIAKRAHWRMIMRGD